MEKVQTKDQFSPYSNSKLEKAETFLNSLQENTSSFRISGHHNSLLKFISRIIKSLENIIGPLLVWKVNTQEDPFPAKWSNIVNYLKKGKFAENVNIFPSYFDEPKFFTASIGISPEAFKKSDGRLPQLAGGFGASLNFEELIPKIIGEFLERYSLCIYKESDFKKVSLSELKRKRLPFLDINKISQPSEKQKEENIKLRYAEDSQFLWARGKSLLSEKEVAIPSQLIFWNYNRDHKDWKEPVIREANTNGAGGYFTLTGAILSGLYESIERDGFYVYWYNHFGPPKINMDSVESEPLKKLLEECRRFKFEIYFLNTTTDISIPSCVCCVVDNTGIGPKAAIGAGCGMDWEKILLKSLIEAFSVFNPERTRMEEGNFYDTEIGLDYIPFSDWSLDRAKRLDILANEKNFHNFQFFLEGKTQNLSALKKNKRHFPSKKIELNFVVEIFKKFRRADYEIFYYRAQNELLEELGYAAVKVIVPALIYLNLAEPLACLNSKRIREVPPKLGFEPAEKINPWPHPFP